MCESLADVRIPKVFLKPSREWWQMHFSEKVIDIIKSNSN